VSKVYDAPEGRIKAVENLDFSVYDGEFVSILGPSGCGKTTTVNMISGFDRPTSGVVEYRGKEVSGPSPERIVVFQEHSLFPWLTVWGNVAFGMECLRYPKDEVARVVAGKLELVGLGDFKDVYPYELSGGMKQRASLARALTLNPDILLLDEPFAGLDAITRHRLISEMERILLTDRRTIIFVTHSIMDAVQISDRIIVMSKQPGTVAADIKVELKRPRDLVDGKFIDVRRTVLESLGEKTA